MFLASNQVAVHDPRLRKVHESWQVELSSVSLYMGKSFNTRGGLFFSFCFCYLCFVFPAWLLWLLWLLWVCGFCALPCFTYLIIYLIYCNLILSNLISFYLVLSCLILSYLVLTYLSNLSNISSLSI